MRMFAARVLIGSSVLLTFGDVSFAISLRIRLMV